MVPDCLGTISTLAAAAAGAITYLEEIDRIMIMSTAIYGLLCYFREH